MEEKDILKEEVGQQQDAVNEEAGDVQVDAQPETETDEKTMEEKLVELQLENARLNDQLLRKIAEFENFRKRTIKEKTDLILNGGCTATALFCMPMARASGWRV